jgi:hypothetical protein
VTQGAAAEPLWGKGIHCTKDPEIFDQGEQTTFVHAPELSGPPRFQVESPNPGSNDESVIEVGDGGEIPGATC